MTHEADDDIPVLHDLVRPGRREIAGRDTAAGGQVADRSGGLSEAEIEAIARRVVERHTAAMEASIARAIRKALAIRAGTDDPETGGTTE